MHIHSHIHTFKMTRSSETRLHECSMSPVTVGNAAEITGDPIEARYTTRRGYRAAVSASEGTYAPQEPGGAPRGVETDPGEALEVMCPDQDTRRTHQ